MIAVLLGIDNRHSRNHGTMQLLEAFVKSANDLQIMDAISQRRVQGVEKEVKDTSLLFFERIFIFTINFTNLR